MRTQLVGVFLAGLLGGCGSATTSQLPQRTARTTAVRAVWTSGEGGKTRTAGAAPIARRLQLDLRRAPVVAKGAYNCPADFGVRVDLVFDRRAGRVRIPLTGCSFYVPPGGGALRSLTPAARADLRRLAPQHYRRYLEPD